MEFLFDAGQMVFFRCETVRVMLGLSETGGPVGGTVVYYKVDGLEERCAAMERSGVGLTVKPHGVVAKMADHTLWMAVRGTDRCEGAALAHCLR